MKIKELRIPTIVIAIGLIAALLVSLLTGVTKVPTITEHDFHHTVTYKLNGETKTLEGVHRVQFTSTGKGTDPLDRHYEGTYLTNPAEFHPAAYTIAERDGLELCIITIFSDKYLMGDTKGVPEATFLTDPYLAVVDREGYEYEDAEMLSKFDAELISWEHPEPIENSFVFAGFSGLHDGSMIAMLLVGILVIIACLILVKRDKTVAYRVLDKTGVILNYVITLAAIPFFTLIALASQIVVSGSEWSYQLLLCTPAITAFGVAVSLSLRRKGFTKSGFFIQFVGPALFFLFLFL